MHIITFVGFLIVSCIYVNGADLYLNGSIGVTPLYFKEGGNLRLVCVQPNPVGSNVASWLKSGGQSGNNLENNRNLGYLVTRSDEQVNGTRVRNNILTKSNITQDAAGEYQCKKDDNSPAFRVDVVVFTVNNVDAEVEEGGGGDATIGCNFEGLTAKTVVSWKRHEEPIARDDSKYTVHTVNNTLVIHHVDNKDIGEYQCEFNLQGKTFSHSVMVQGGPGVKPFKQSKNLVQGERLRLECDAWGHPLPSVHWLHEDAAIDFTDDRISVESFNEIEDGTLIIEDVDFDDAGPYTCIATSMKNSANSTVTVRVKDKLAALWPFLGIVGEVTILCIIIFIYEKRRAKKMAENEEPEEAHLTNSNAHEGVRQRK